MNNLSNFSTALISGTIPAKLNIKDIDIFEIMESGIFDNIPGIGEIISVGKSIMNIRDKFTFKKFIIFLQSYNKINIDEDKLNTFRNRFQNDKSYRIKITEYLISYLDDFKRIEKSEIYANLFAEYINEAYSWEHFLNLSDLLSRINIDSLIKMPMIDTQEGKDVKTFNEKESSIEADMISSGLAMRLSVWSSSIYPTSLGKDLYKYGIKNNNRELF